MKRSLFLFYFVLFLFGRHIWLYAGLTPSSELGDYFWWCSGDRMKCWGLNSGQRKCPYLLYYYSDSKKESVTVIKISFVSDMEK